MMTSPTSTPPTPLQPPAPTPTTSTSTLQCPPSEASSLGGVAFVLAPACAKLSVWLAILCSLVPFWPSRRIVVRVFELFIARSLLAPWHCVLYLFYNPKNYLWLLSAWSCLGLLLR